MYQALYRKWRPRTFDEVTGQAHITDTLRRQVSEGRLSHAYLFTGTRGTGKTTCAKILAKAANCQAPQNGNPCNACPACLGIESGSILDVLELDAASNNGVDHVRALRDEAVYTPAAVSKRVYIVDEVHMLSTAAFNALLKILEEPPVHLMFILATTELHKVPATIKSRCQQFAFKRILPGEIAARLSFVAEREGIPLTEDGAALLARLSDGGLRDGLSLLDQCAGSGGQIGEGEIFTALGLAGSVETEKLMEHIAGRDGGEALETAARLYQGGKDMAALLGELSTLARDLLVRRTAPRGGGALLTGGFDETTLRSLGERLPTPRLMQILHLLQAAQGDLARSTNRRTDVELCLLRLCDETLDDGQAGIAARLARLEELCRSGLPTPEAAPFVAIPIVRTPPAAAAPTSDPPPWDVPSPPAPKPRIEAASPVSLQKTPPVAESPVPQPAAAPAEDDGGAWAGVVANLRGKVPPQAATFLRNPAFCRGVYSGDAGLTVRVDSETTRHILNKPEIITAIARVAEGVVGGPVAVFIRVAPLDGPAPAAASPASAADKLDDLLALGRQFGNITIKE